VTSIGPTLLPMPPIRDVSWRGHILEKWSHKSVILSTSATEYYEASESCREVSFIRSIMEMEDFYKFKPEPTPLIINNQTAVCMSTVYRKMSTVYRDIFLFVFATYKNAVLNN